MMKAELMTTRITSLDTITNHSTTLIMLLVSWTQCYMWTKLDTVQWKNRPCKAFAAGGKIDTTKPEQLSSD